MRGLRGREVELTAAPQRARLRLRRDALTWTVYGWLGTWGWFVFGFGPAVPLLREEQGTTRSVAALHGTMLAIGGVLAGLLVLVVTRRYGRRAVLVGGAGLLAAGVLLLVSGGGLEVTLPGALLAGTGGSSALNASSPTLAEHHGAAGPSAISEANAVAALVGVAAPLTLGASVAAGLGWRPAIAVAAVLGIASALAVRRLPAVPALGRGVGPAASGTRVPLGAPFWLVLGMLALGVGVEFSMTFWAGDLLQVQLGTHPGVAAASVTGFVAGMASGRYVAGRLALRYAVPTLLLGALVTATAGWLLLWTAGTLAVAVAGLVVTGFGVAMLFPLGISLLMQSSGGRPDVATAAASAAAGVAIGAAPFALGALADALGAERGFLLVPAMLAVAFALLLIATQGTARASAH